MPMRVRPELGWPFAVPQVQERLGHASVKVTLDTYSHVMPPMHHEAAARVAAMVDGA